MITQEYPNDPTVWRVESEARPGQHHIVELLNFDGFGACTCEHFGYRIEPGLRDGFPEKPCKHIVEAKLALADAILGKMIENMRDMTSKDG